MGGVLLAVDIGGTKMEAGIVTLAGSIEYRHRVPTPKGDAGQVFAALARLIDEVLGRLPEKELLACGVGCGGPMSKGGEYVSPVNIGGWRNFPLKKELEDLLALPVYVDNDAKALTLAEGAWGRARGLDSYMGMVVSTGIGGGIVLDGRLLDGHDGNAGHVGHIIVEPFGRVCGCGARGCVEAEASGSALERMTGRPPKEAPVELRRRTGRLVGRAVASVINLLDLKGVFIGGSVALGFGTDFFNSLKEEVRSRCKIEFARGAEVGPVSLGADAPLLGAACVAMYRGGIKAETGP